MDSSAIPGAVCPLHPDQAITFNCARCGAFGCERCRASTPGICLACEARAAEVPVSVGAVLGEGFSMTVKRPELLAGLLWLKVALDLGTSIYNVKVIEPLTREFTRQYSANPDPHRIFEFLGGVAGQLVVLLLLAVVLGHLVVACLVQHFGDIARGRTRSLGQLWIAGLRAYPATLAVILLWSLGLSVGAVFCCVPAVWLMAMLCVASVAVGIGDRPRRVFAALGESWSLVRGRFWTVLAVQLILAAFAGSVSGVAGMVSALFRMVGPVGQAIGVAAPVAAGAIVVVPMAATNVALYLQLRKAAPR